MKSLRIHSYDSQQKLIKSRNSLGKKDAFVDRPTPLDFDSFIPWFCLELQMSKNVIVTRTHQVAYIRQVSRLSKDSSAKSSKSKSKSTKIKFSPTKSSIEGKITSGTSTIQKVNFASSTINIEDAVPVNTCYDKHGRLVEISIVGCPFPIPRKVIQAFNLCLPFHSGLFKLSIRKGGLCQTILYEISKLLALSNITEVILDDSFVVEGNYSIILSRPSQVKYLSLKRCGISDKECKNIATMIDLKGPALKTLLLLDLTSNLITDEGAQALGEALKNNRHLLYLNLSGNYISDTGAHFILTYLQEFPLAFDDIKQTRMRRLDYLILKSITYEKCLEEVKLARLETKSTKDSNTSGDQIHPIIYSAKHNRKSKKHLVQSFIVEESTVQEDAERKAIEIIGQFEDPFKKESIKRKGESLYAIGNFTLTSLNLAYNNLTCLSVKKILKVLKYQSEISKLTTNTGLLKVVVDGNSLPTNCNELYEIDIYLKRALLQKERLSFISFTSNSFN